jgi:hypothetical protein
MEPEISVPCSQAPTFGSYPEQARDMKEIKYDNRDIKELVGFKHLGSKIVTNGSAKEEIMDGIRNSGKFTS